MTTTGLRAAIQREIGRCDQRIRFWYPERCFAAEGRKEAFEEVLKMLDAPPKEEPEK